MRVDGASQRVRRQRMALARALAQLAYWLEAELLVYPEVTGAPVPGAGEEEAAEAPEMRPPPAAGLWADVPHWRRVEKLTAGQKLPPLTLVGRVASEADDAE